MSSIDSSITPCLLPASRHQSRPLPSRSEIATPSVSSGVRSANNWLIWNVRAMPSRTRSCGFKSVMSRPSSMMRPALGLSTPVRRLTSVVLPAPLGPINAWRAPRSTLSETLLAATMPPKRLSRFSVASAVGIGLRLGHGLARAQAENPLADRAAQLLQALAPDEDDHHQHEADPELPVLRRQAREPVLHQLEDQRADDAAIEIAGAADDQHQEHVGGALEREHVERGKLRRLREQGAGDAGIARGDGVDRDQAAVHGNADGGSAQRIGLHRAERKPEGRIDDAAREQKEDEQHREAVGIGGVAEHIEAKPPEQRVDDDALQAVGAAGQPVIAVAELAQHERDAKRHHDAGEIRDAQDEEARHETKRGGRHPGDQQRERGLADELVLRQEAGAIGAESEERRLAERDDAGIAENEIEREREQAEDRDLGENQVAAGKEENRREGGDPEDDFGKPPARPAHHQARGVGRGEGSGTHAARPVAGIISRSRARTIPADAKSAPRS